MNNPRRVRMKIACSPKEKKYIKALAALEDMSMGAYLLSLARIKMDQLSSGDLILSQIMIKKMMKKIFGSF